MQPGSIVANQSSTARPRRPADLTLDGRSRQSSRPRPYRKRVDHSTALSSGCGQGGAVFGEKLLESSIIETELPQKVLGLCPTSCGGKVRPGALSDMVKPATAPQDHPGGCRAQRACAIPAWRDLRIGKCFLQVAHSRCRNAALAEKALPIFGRHGHDDLPERAFFLRMAVKTLVVADLDQVLRPARSTGGVAAPGWRRRSSGLRRMLDRDRWWQRKTIAFGLGMAAIPEIAGDGGLHSISATSSIETSTNCPCRRCARAAKAPP